MLRNSPPLAAGWLYLFTAIRQKCGLGGVCRKLANLRVAIINGAEQDRTHVPFALKEGFTEARICALDKWRESRFFSDAQRAVLACADAMTREIRVANSVFDALRSYFERRQPGELTPTTAGYNMAPRFLEALAIDPEAAQTQAGTIAG